MIDDEEIQGQLTGDLTRLHSQRAGSRATAARHRQVFPLMRDAIWRMQREENLERVLDVIRSSLKELGLRLILARYSSPGRVTHRPAAEAARN
jgi:hypothetical protein